MKAGIVAIGVILTVLGILLWSYEPISYVVAYYLGDALRLIGAVLAAIGLGLIVLGVLKKESKLPPPPQS